MKLKLKHNPSLIIGIVITGVILLIAIVGLFWTPYSTTSFWMCHRYDHRIYCRVQGRLAG